MSSLPLSGSNEFPDDGLSSLASFVQDLSKFPPITRQNIYAMYKISINYPSPSQIDTYYRISNNMKWLLRTLNVRMYSTAEGILEIYFKA